MPVPSVAKVIDRLMAEVLATPLRERGFRRRGRHWSATEDRVHRGVTVQASQFNVRGDARFTVEIGVAYPPLGHRPPAYGSWGCAFAHRLSWLTDEPSDIWFQFDTDDDATIAAAGAELASAWAQHGEALVDAARSPEELCDHVAAGGNVVVALSALEQVAVPLGDVGRQVALVARAADHATGMRWWRQAEDTPHRNEHGLTHWGEIIGHCVRLGVALSPDHRAAARVVLEDATAGRLSTPYHSEIDEAAAVAIANALGLPIP